MKKKYEEPEMNIQYFNVVEFMFATTDDVIGEDEDDWGLYIL